jgi:hypothetical protein
VVPNEFRGQPDERRARTAVLEILDHAMHEPDRRDHWVGVVRALHELAAAHRLHETPASTLERMAAED